MKFPPYDGRAIGRLQRKAPVRSSCRSAPPSPVPARRWHCGAINNVILHPLAAIPLTIPRASLASPWWRLQLNAHRYHRYAYTTTPSALPPTPGARYIALSTEGCVGTCQGRRSGPYDPEQIPRELTRAGREGIPSRLLVALWSDLLRREPAPARKTRRRGLPPPSHPSFVRTREKY